MHRSLPLGCRPMADSLSSRDGMRSDSMRPGRHDIAGLLTMGPIFNSQESRRPFLNQEVASYGSE